jgi:hypothetical protein
MTRLIKPTTERTENIVRFMFLSQAEFDTPATERSRPAGKADLSFGSGAEPVPCEAVTRSSG